MIAPNFARFVISLAAVFSPIAGSRAQVLEATIPMPPPASARDLLYNPLSNKIYTANVADVGMPPSNSVTILDGATNAIRTTLSVADGPRDLCLNTQRNKVYVANYFADSVSVIDGVTDQLLAVIPVGDGPRALCYNSQNDRVYCANEFSANVTVIDGATDVAMATVAVGSTPRVICYNPTSNKVYVPNSGSQSLSVIAGATNTVVATVPAGAIPRGVCFNPQNNRVYVSNYSSDTVTVIDGVTNAVVATVPVGDGPTALFHNPVGNKVYCSNVGAPGPNTPAACTVSVISGATNAVVTTLPAGDEPTAFCFSSNNQKVYWVNEWSHTVAVVDAATDVQLLLIPLGAGTVQPVDLCYNPINERVYTANRLTYSIGVISDSRDVTLPAFGNSSGSSFDLRAPAEQRIAAVDISLGAGLDALRVQYKGRSGSPSATSVWVGSPVASPVMFQIPVGDQLGRVEVWYEAATARIRGIALSTKGGQRQMFGQAIGSLQTFDSATSTEIIGFRGTATTQMQSLGVTTRPLLGGHFVEGAACDSGLGVMAIRYRIGKDRFRIGDSVTAEITNVASPFGILGLGFAAISQPLDGLGAPGCWAYSSGDMLLIGSVDASNTAAATISVPPNPVLVGALVDFQGASLLAPNALGIATSNVLRAQVGSL